MPNGTKVSVWQQEEEILVKLSCYLEMTLREGWGQGKQRGAYFDILQQQGREVLLLEPYW